MATKAGVWIDHQQAVVVLIKDAGQETKKFKSVMEPRAQAASGSRSKHKYTPNDFVADETRERRLVDERKKVYDEALACIRGADALLILGPGEAKGEFKKCIKGKKLRGLTVALETSDRMTDRQIAAKVGGHFAETSKSKSVVPKKNAKAMSRQRRKKTST
jgi:hypothetical protein